LIGIHLWFRILGKAEEEKKESKSLSAELSSVGHEHINKLKD
jgi:hypothetical protein